MATASELEERGLLETIDGILDSGQMPQRSIYFMPRAKEWLVTKLDELQSDGFYDNVPSPTEQAYDILRAYLAGEDLQGDWPPHSMHPGEDGVWELRTPDLRFFGWFWKPKIFIASAVEQKIKCEAHSLYSGYRNQAKRDCEIIGLDPPPFITGEYKDVF